MVDNLQYELGDDPKGDHPHWPNPIGEVPTRSRFDRHVKFVAAHARPADGSVSLDNRQPLAVQPLSLDLRREELEVWPGVDMTRGLFLTQEYLCDFFQLASDKPRQYDWHVHALGLFEPNGSWKPTNELTDRLYDTSNRAIAPRLADPVERDRYQLKNVRKLAAGDRPWDALVLQTCALGDDGGVLGRAWYDRRIGVRVHMLGEPGTTIYAGQTPVNRSVGGKEKNKGERSDLPNEVGGTTLLVRRNTPATVFATVHEPVQDAQSRIAAFRRVAQNEQGIVVAVDGQPGTAINDRILFRFTETGDASLTLTGDGESFSFVDHAYIRIRRNRVDVTGDVRGLRLKVEGQPKLFLNDKPKKADVADGVLVLGNGGLHPGEPAGTGY